MRSWCGCNAGVGGSLCVSLAFRWYNMTAPGSTELSWTSGGLGTGTLGEPFGDVGCCGVNGAMEPASFHGLITMFLVGLSWQKFLAHFFLGCGWPAFLLAGVAFGDFPILCRRGERRVVQVALSRVCTGDLRSHTQTTLPNDQPWNHRNTPTAGAVRTWRACARSTHHPYAN